MESDKIYEQSYNEITGLLKACTCDSMVIDFTKLDRETAGELRNKINSTLLARKAKIGVMINNTAKLG